jgi:Catalytic LigB subunit of aromatic ring-opening dioxygenase
MAQICSIIATSHSPFLFKPQEWWNQVRDARPRTDRNPRDSDADNAHKLARTRAAMSELREVFQRAKPDVAVVFGDDQEEQFCLRNLPAFAIYAGGDFEGYRELAYSGVPGSRQLVPKSAENWTRVPARPDLARALLAELLRSGFDPAFMMNLPNEAHGMGHAFMRPIGNLTAGRFDVPVLPVMVNCFYAPQPTASRCVAAARAIAKAIESWPAGIRVAVVGSGGLWHTPGAHDAYIDSEFDRAILDGLAKGEADHMADYFDRWRPRPELEHLRCYETFSGGTRMTGGIGSGAGETRNWIMAAAIADRPGVVVDYVPVYASPCGMAFAYWDCNE